MKDANQATDPFDDIKLVPRPSEKMLNERQFIDYRTDREQCLDWLLSFGKEPEYAEGYAKTTVKNRASRMDQFYRWVWNEEDGYTSALTHEHADGYLNHLARQEKSNAHKNACRKALMMLFKWRHHQRGAEQWEPALTFTQKNQSTTPRDYLTRNERTKIRDAALEIGSIPSRDNVYGEESDKWEAYLAQRFEKPKEEITAEDWDRANSWKVPSLVGVSLDAGLRPIEVERARTSWVDLENGVLRIPREDASKNAENWIVGLQDQTVEMTSRWLEERSTIEKYDDTGDVWLTRESNPYQSASLRGLLHRLCDIADISVENRQMSWYTIRHSTGTYMTREEDLAAAQTQLRHKSPESTMKYDQVPIEDRKNALDRMG